MSISYEKLVKKDSEIYSFLDSNISKWFKNKYKKFSPPQKLAIHNIHNKKNTIVSAPTGSGKTMSGFLSILNELTILSKQEKLLDSVYCIYVSPLKALNNDVNRNLIEPLSEIEEVVGKDLGIRTGVRTGDTTPYQRQKMLKKAPHILITTPESLALMITSPKFSEKLKTVKWMIIDEIHSIAQNKRGVHLSLSMERLTKLAGDYTRIGLSATVSPIEEVAKYLVGYKNGKLRECKIVDCSFAKQLDLKVLSPVKNIMQTTQKDLNKSFYKLLEEQIDGHKTTLIFTNTRSGTERIVHKLRGKYGDKIEAHHSAISKDERIKTEESLKNGDLKVVVCSTSLELGIDIGSIDLVLMVGSPKSVARALQRVGRSGHQLHSKIKGRFIVSDRDDLVECSVMLKNAKDGNIDRVDIPTNCLDVLAQHIYGEAIYAKQDITKLYKLFKQSYCYQRLTKKQYNELLSYLAGEYSSLEDRYIYAKIWIDKEENMLGKRGRLARVIYATNIGTIPDESYIRVKIGNQTIGSLDEGFLEKLKKGDIFVLGGKTYRYNYARGMTVQVTPMPGRVPTVPSWFSESLPLSYDLAMDIQKFRKYMSDMFENKYTKKQIVKYINDYLYVDSFAANSIYEYFREQHVYSEIPHSKKILVEFYKGYGGKKYTVFHTLYGRRVNDALSRAIAYDLTKRTRKGVSVSINDNGFYITADTDKIQAIQSLMNLTPEVIESHLRNSLEYSEVLKRRFRHCAGRSLMILRSYRGRRKSAGRQQIGAMILINAVREISEEFPVLKEARREVMEDLMDIENAKNVVGDIQKGKIKVKNISTDIPTPFAMNLITRGYMDIVKFEDKREFIRRMHEALIKRIGK